LKNKVLQQESQSYQIQLSEYSDKNRNLAKLLQAQEALTNVRIFLISTLLKINVV
jgi:hypothetical protein